MEVLTETAAAPKAGLKKPRSQWKPTQRITDNTALVAIDKIERVFATLDLSAKARVLSYINHLVYAEQAKTGQAVQTPGPVSAVGGML